MKTTIKLKRAYPNGTIIGVLLTIPFGFLSITTLLDIFQSQSMEEFFWMLIGFIILLGFTALGLMPLISYSKVFIDTDAKTIHYCTHLLGLFKDLKPLPYEHFQKLKFLQNKRGGSIQTRFQGSYNYKVIEQDILLYDDSRKHKLLIKNVGKGDEAIKIANQLCEILGIEFIKPHQD